MASHGTGQRVLGLPVGFAFGLVSVVVAVAIVGLLWRQQIESVGEGAKALGAGGGKGPAQIIDATKLQSTIIKLRQAGTALDQWQFEQGGFPEDISLVRGGRGNPPDAWGAEMVYEPMDPKGRDGEGRTSYRRYELRSAGADGLMGTDDDLVMSNGMVRLPEGPRGGGRSERAASDESEASGGMTDPSPSGDHTVAGRRALEAARGLAGGQKRGREKEEESE